MQSQDTPTLLGAIPLFLCDLLAAEGAGKLPMTPMFTTLSGKPHRNLNFRCDIFAGPQ